MALVIPLFVASVPLLATVIILYWISANPKQVEVVGKAIGDAFGQAGKGVGEGIITPLLEYSVLGGIAALGLALLYRAAGRLTGAPLPEPPAPPGFAPAPQFGTAVGVRAGPISGTVGTVPAPLEPGLASELAARRQQRSRQPRRR